MRPRTTQDGVPWFPDCITPFASSPADARAGWCYVVVEEVAGAVAEVMRWPWPLADQIGQLFWPEGDRDRLVTAVVSLPTLRQQMYEPSGLRRSPRAGDAFAAELGGTGWSDLDADDEPVIDLGKLFPGRVVDISADARDAAKLAYQGANAAIYDGSEAEDLMDTAGRERTQRSPAPTLTVIGPDAQRDRDREARA